MSLGHIETKNFETLDEYETNKRQDHLIILEKRHNELNVESLSLSEKSFEELKIHDAESQEKDRIRQILENREKFLDISVDLPDFADLFCPILSVDDRRQKLIECSDLAEEDFDANESKENEAIHLSRQVCGCSCKEKGIACQSETCSCFLNGIGCEQKKTRFPCSCILKYCKNPNGMKRFDFKAITSNLNKVLDLYKKNGLDFQTTNEEEHGLVKKTTKRKRLSKNKFTTKRKKKAPSTTLIAMPTKNQPTVDHQSTSDQEQTTKSYP
jgi:hypothetical protein